MYDEPTGQQQEEREYYEGLLGLNDDPRINELRKVGDKPKVNRVIITDWKNWTDTDNDARSPLEADLEDREAPF